MLLFGSQSFDDEDGDKDFLPDDLRSQIGDPPDPENTTVHPLIEPFLDAIDEGNIERARDYLAQGLGIDAFNEAGSTAMLYAIEAGNLERVQLLIRLGADVNYTTPLPNPLCPLISACIDGHSDIVLELVRNGATLDRTALGYNAIVWAAQSEHYGTVRVLLEQGLHIDHANAHGATALMVAAGDGEFKWLSEESRLKAVRTLLDLGASLDKQDVRGETALMWAAEQGHTAIVAELLQRGASIHFKNEQGHTALSLAEGNNHRDTVECLRRAEGHSFVRGF